MGLREDKKAATRLAISDIATALFLEKGFDAVSVADVAKAAKVSKMTVFNYFARKEDLLFDRDDEARHLMRAAMLSGEAPLVDRMQVLAKQLVKVEHPFTKWTAGTEKFFDIVRASPALVARLRELRETSEASLAEVLREAARAKPDDPIAAVLAAGLLMAWRIAYETAAKAPKREAPKVFLRTLDAALDPLRRAAKGTRYG